MLGFERTNQERFTRPPSSPKWEGRESGNVPVLIGKHTGTDEYRFFNELPMRAFFGTTLLLCNSSSRCWLCFEFLVVEPGGNNIVWITHVSAAYYDLLVHKLQGNSARKTPQVIEQVIYWVARNLN